MPDGAPRRSRAEIEADRKEQDRLELREIRANLNGRVSKLAEQLLGAPQTKRGDEWEWPGGLGVAVAGKDCGKWNVWNDPDAKGWPLDLIRWKLGGSFGEAVRYARDFLGMPARGRTMSADERATLAARLDDERKQREAEAAQEAAEKARKQAKATETARAELKAAKPAPEDHPYLQAKGLPAAGWVVDRHNNLLVPAFNARGEHMANQQIAPDGGAAWRAAVPPWTGEGNKRFPANSPMDGLFCLIGGKQDPAKPMRFAEGAATGQSIAACTGEPVAITFSAGNMIKVMRAWRKRNPDQVMITAGDNDHHKPRQDPPKPNVGAEVAARLWSEIGAIPALPPFAEGDAGKDWNDFHRARGAAAVWEEFDRVIESIPKMKQETAAVPDGSTVAPTEAAAAASPPPDPRRLLTEAAAIEAIRTGAATDPAAATRAAKTMVGSMSDEQVASTLASMPDRKWAMRPDGTLDPGAAKAPPTAAKPVDPILAVIGSLQQHSDGLREKSPALAEAINALARKATENPGAFAHEQLRTRVAWVVMDVERATGAKVEMPDDLRRELDGRMVTYPGLTNQRGQALMRETAVLASAALVREIRRTVADIVRGGAQDTPEIGDRLDVLENKVRVRDPGVAPANHTPSGPPDPVPPPAAPPEHHAAADPASPPPAAPPVKPIAEAASPGPGAQPAAAAVYASQPKPQGAQQQSAAGTAAPAGAPAAARQSLASSLLGRLSGSGDAGPRPWEKITSGLAQRIDNFEATQKEKRLGRDVEEAEAFGKTATRMVEEFVSGPGKGVLDRIQAAASRDPGGLTAVIGGMRPGGSHQGLRTDFDRALSDRRFSNGYEDAKAAIEAYGAKRAKLARDVAERGLDAGKLAPLERIDAALGEEAARIPGRAEGKSMLDELASKAAEIFAKAMQAVRDAIRPTPAAAPAAMAAAPSPAP